MSWLKKFWIVFLSFLPFSAGAFWGLLLTGAGVLAGFSIYRTTVPVNMSDAFAFFSTCWTCQMFSDIMMTISVILPRIYKTVGMTLVPIVLALLGLWFVWRIFSGFISSKIDNAWDITGETGQKLVKASLVCALLFAPLPHMLSKVIIEPVFNVGLSINRAIANEIDKDSFSNCVVAAAVADKTVTASSASATNGMFSPQMRHNLACELGNVHQMTGLGLTVGWTMMGMAFDHDYMYQIMWGLVAFPNIGVFLAGLVILVLFFTALLPVPLYFLEIFIGLGVDLVLLPLTLLSWLFEGWKIFPKGDANIKKVINDVVSGTLGIAMTGIFVTFSLLVLGTIFEHWDGASGILTAIQSGDSKYLMDGLFMQNGDSSRSLITIVLMGIFIAMFMTMIPALAKTLFNVEISQKYYDTAKKDVKIMWDGAKKLVSHREK